jgi:hypothetical protein
MNDDELLFCVEKTCPVETKLIINMSDIEKH